MFRKIVGTKKGLLTVAAAGALLVASPLALTAFAQSAFDEQQDVVMTEASTLTPVMAASEAVASTPASALVSLTDEQAAPFIKAAEGALQANQVKLPESGYWTQVAHFADLNEVEVFWYPNSWKDPGPWQDLGPVDFTEETTYFAHFKDVNLQNGSGVVDTVRAIQPGDWSKPATSTEASTTEDETIEATAIEASTK